MFDSTADDPLAGIHDHLGRLAGEDRSGWSGGARSDRVVELLRAAERLQAEVLRAIGEWDRTQAWSADGALSPVAWLADRAPVTGTVAARLVRSSRLVRGHDRLRSELSTGRISCAHVDVISEVTRRREDVFAEHSAPLLDAALQYPPEEFRTSARRWRGLADDIVASGDAYETYERRGFYLSKSTGAVFLDGVLDLEAGGKLESGLALYDHPDPNGGPVRSLGQRRADALLAMAEDALARRGTPGPRRAGAGVDLVLDVATALGSAPTDLAAVRCEIQGIGPVARETARRICCDHAIGRVLMNGPSEVLDLGRRTRVVTPAQRRALAVRDGGCVFPGCDRPPPWTDAHHLVHWLDNGPSNLDNLVLLCRRHHVLCHEGRWQLQRGPDGTVTAERPRPRPRGPDLTLAA